MINATFTKIRIFATLAILIASSSGHGAAVRGDGRLNLYYDARKEQLDITYRNSRGNIIPSALEKINFFLRSPDNQVHAIDVQLLDLIDAIQDRFHEPVIEIISAYRSPDYNKGLKDAGRNVANESLHMQGKAMDIHLDTVTEEVVRDYAISLGLGGVGWYPQNDFVHVDLGPVRTWGHAENQRKWVGLENNHGSDDIRSTENRYFGHQAVQLTVQPRVTPVTGDFTLDSSAILHSHLNAKTWTLERFDRGTWTTVHVGTLIAKNMTIRIPASTLDLLSRGRYRLRLGESLSNEFYLKN